MVKSNKITILALDISTKTGWSVLSKEGDIITLDDYGLWKPVYGVIDWLKFGESSVESALKLCFNLSSLVLDKVMKVRPNKVVIEQTNLSMNSRYSQKVLEWLHYKVIETLLMKNKGMPHYISSSEWRSVVGIKLTKEQKQHNKEVKTKAKKGKVTTKHLAVDMANKIFNKDFILKDNDITDSILLGYAYLKKYA